jgi:hypothetical protein
MQAEAAVVLINQIYKVLVDLAVAELEELR